MTHEPPALKRLRTLSVLMDSKFVGPLGLKFGVDALIGFIPVLGDFIGAGVSLYIIFEAAMLGCGPAVLLRMGVNVLIETVIGLIPLIGNVFDFVWKANNKNIVLLESHVLNPRGAIVESRLVLGSIAFIILLFFIGTISLSVYLFKVLYDLIAL